MPKVSADEGRARVSYYVHGDVGSPGLEADAVATVAFLVCYALMFGPPNDEAFGGHPLSKRGLHPHGAFEVEHSSWVRALERMNRAHPYHKAERFGRLRHFGSRSTT